MEDAQVSDAPVDSFGQTAAQLTLAPELSAAETRERRDGAGYFVIALEGGCVPSGRLVPFDERFVHVADGGYMAWVDMTPGEYHVCLMVADGNHRATPLVHEVSFEVVEN